MNGFEPVTGAAMAELHRQHLSRDFPRNELKPLHMLEDLVERGINSVWAMEREENLAAYFVLARLPGQSMVLLDYFAVEPQFRDCGLGTQVMKTVAAGLEEDEYLLIESEWPLSAAAEERMVRQRRLDFYLRCGAVWSGGCARLFGVEYALLTLGTHTPTLEEVFQGYRDIYQSMVPAHRLHGNLETFCPEE